MDSAADHAASEPGLLVPAPGVDATAIDAENDDRRLIDALAIELADADGAALAAWVRATRAARRTLDAVPPIPPPR